MSDADVELGIDAHRPIVIPEGKFEAPRDYSLRTEHINLVGRRQPVELIKQEFAGNCAEYTTLNTAIILKAAGFALNGDIETQLEAPTALDMSTIETDIVIPLVSQAQQEIGGIRLTDRDKENLMVKVDNPYEPLTNKNSAWFFRKALSPVNQDIQAGDIARSYTPEVDSRIKSTETVAVMIGSMHHATSMVKLGPKYYYIDPYYGSRIVTEMNQEQAQARLREDLRQPEAFMTLNDLRKK